jgi:hypothetical protein
MKMSREWRVPWPFRILAGFIALCGIIGLLYSVAVIVGSGVAALSVGNVIALLGVLWFTPPMAWVALRGTRPWWPGF